MVYAVVGLCLVVLVAGTAFVAARRRRRRAAAAARAYAASRASRSRSKRRRSRADRSTAGPQRRDAGSDDDSDSYLASSDDASRGVWHDPGRREHADGDLSASGTHELVAGGSAAGDVEKLESSYSPSSDWTPSGESSTSFDSSSSSGSDYGSSSDTGGSSSSDY